MKRRISPLRILACLVILGAILFVALFVFVMLGQWTFQAAWAFLSGWITYPVRVIPQINYNVEMILCGLVAFGLAEYFSHRLLKWLSENLSPLPSPWPFRFTALLSFLLLSTFGTSIAMTGIIHQSAWLARSGSITTKAGSGSITIKQHLNARELSLNLIEAATEDPDSRFSKSLTQLDKILEYEEGTSPILCPYEQGGDAPWLYPAAFEIRGGVSPIIISPRPNHRGYIVVAYSDLTVERLRFDELPPDVAIYFE